MSDIIVIGAGPAGCAATIMLKKAGFNVTLVNKPSKTVFKIGESLPVATIKLLRRLGFKNISELLNQNSYLPCLTTLSSWNSESWSFKDSIINPEGNGWQIDRVAFDDALKLECIKLGSTILNAHVKSITGNTSSANPRNNYSVKVYKQDTNISCEMHADWIIDATGRSFCSGKFLNIGRLRFDDQMAVICWIKSPVLAIEHSIRIRSEYEGWWYSSCLPNGNRVIVFHGLGKKISSLVKDPFKFVEACNASKLLDQNIKEDLITTPLAMSANVSKAEKCAKGHWLAAGDAALSFDPLSSQGIFFALYTGIKAAEVIIESNKFPDQKKDLMNRYSDIIWKIFEENQIARSYHYYSETRFKKSEYWSTMHAL